MVFNFVFWSFLFECFSCNKKAKSKNVKKDVCMDIGGVINHIKTKILPEIMTFRQWCHLRLVKI